MFSKVETKVFSADVRVESSDAL